MNDDRANDFDHAFRPVLVCTVVWGLMVISMLDFLGSTVGTLPLPAARHAVSGFRLTFFVFTFYMLLLGLLYAFGHVFGPKVRKAINAASGIVFLFSFGVVGDEFGQAFNSIPGLGPVGFDGPAQQAIGAVLSLPIATMIALCVVLIMRAAGRRRARRAALARDDAHPDQT